MPGEHAILSPSGAHRWIHCVGSPAMEAPYPESQSEYADEGSAAHEVAQRCFTYNKPASFFVGETIYLGRGERQVPVTEDMANYVQVYVDNVLARVEMYKQAGATSVELLVEQKLPIGHITGEEGATGTGDAVIVVEFPDGTGLIDCNDLKFGRGTKVEAKENPQMAMYTLGALEEYGVLGDFKRFVFVIHQPRIVKAPSEWECDLAWLEAFKAKAHDKAVRATRILEHSFIQGAVPPDSLTPGEKQCHFCKAKATCPALQNYVLTTVTDDFVDLTKPGTIKPKLEAAKERIAQADNATLAILLPQLDLIKEWCDAVLARATSELLAGNPVPGFKLVEGKKGNRAWSDEATAEAAMKAMRLKQDEMYKFKLISPTDAEKLLAKDNPRRWTKLEALITRADGKPALAPESDKRPAIVVAAPAEDFEDVSEATGAEDLV